MEKMNEKISIIMATYNGEEYIGDQINSIMTQTYSNWELIIRDDGSTDSTVLLIEKYINLDNRIRLIKGENVGVTRNYGLLLKEVANRDYVMFCDQDDVWKEDKLSMTMAYMKEAEQQHSNYPILVFSDKRNVNQDLCELQKDRKNKIHRGYNLWEILCMNPIYGCTMMLNRRLIDLVICIPSYINIYDYWVSLNAALSGYIIHIPKELMLYRQHGKNVTGGMDNYSLRRKISNWNRTNMIIKKEIFQNYCFCENNDINYSTHNYIDMVSSKKSIRLLKAMKYNYAVDGLLSTIRLWLVLMAYDSEEFMYAE